MKGSGAMIRKADQTRTGNSEVLHTIKYVCNLHIKLERQSKRLKRPRADRQGVSALQGLRHACDK